MLAFRICPGRAVRRSTTVPALFLFLHFLILYYFTVFSVQILVFYLEYSCKCFGCLFCLIVAQGYTWYDHQTPSPKNHALIRFFTFE
jgi:hypothetical protein